MSCASQMVRPIRMIRHDRQMMHIDASRRFER
jgi:hypothetical protein